MKTKNTLKAISFGFIISSVLLLASCSTSNQLTQNPHYRLDLVKANTHPLPIEKKENEATSDIAPMLSHGSLVSYQSDDNIKALNNLLKADVKAYKNQVKKSDPVVYKQIKSVNINKAVNTAVKYLTNKSYRNKQSVTKTNNGGGSSRYLTLFIVFLLLALLFYVLAFGAGIFWVFGFISSIAAVIFFILWIVSLT